MGRRIEEEKEEEEEEDVVLLVWSVVTVDEVVWTMIYRH